MDRNYIDDLKSRVSISEIIGEDEPLTGRGRKLRGQKHDSLVVDVKKGAWYWNSRSEQGDVFTWLELHRGMDFKTAVEYLARKAHMDVPQWSQQDAEARRAANAQADALTVAARHFVLNLRNNKRASSYCLQRGWSDETIKAAGLGYWCGDRAALRSEFSMHSVDLGLPAARALLNMPSGGEWGYIIYPHVEWGRVVYISLRLCYRGDKSELPDGVLAHYNLPYDLVGERKPLWNDVAIPGQGMIVVVEGQADAVTLAQWNVPAVAMAGVRAGDTGEGRRLLLLLRKHKGRVYVGLDQDDAGAVGARAMADALGPSIHVVRWPEHDANDFLTNQPAKATSAAVFELIKSSPTFIEVFARQVGGMHNNQRERGLRDLFGFVARLDEFKRDLLRDSLARDAGLKLREYDRLLRTTLKEREEIGVDDGDPSVTISTVGGLIEGHLVETIYQVPDGAAGASARNGGKTLYAIRDPNGHIRQSPHLDIEDVRYVPPLPDSQILIERVVRFAPQVGVLLSTRELVSKIQDTIHRYMDVDPFYETLSSYYVIFTWLYDAFNTLPYLRVLGDAGTGKSRFLQVVGSLCYRPTTVTGAATTSPIFRLIDRYRGTLVMDESDFGRSDEAADIVKIFNTGYQRSQGIVLRAGAKENNFDPEVYVVYGPKILASRQRFQDWAVESRCLTKEMGGPTMRTDIPIELPREFWTSEVPELHSLLLRYRLAHWKPEMNLDHSQLDPSLEPRLNQVMLALVSIVDDEDLKADLRAFMRRYNEQLISERGLTLTAKVLEAIVAQWEIECDKDEDKRDMTLKTIAGRADQLMDFENLDEDEEYQGRGLSGKKVGHIARKDLQLQTDRLGHWNGRYGIIWNPPRIDGLRRRYGIDDARLREIVASIHEMDARAYEREQARIDAAHSVYGH